MSSDEDFKPYPIDAPEIATLNMLVAQHTREMWATVLRVLRAANEMKDRLGEMGFDPQDPEGYRAFMIKTHDEGDRGPGRDLHSEAKHHMERMADHIQDFQIAYTQAGELTRMKLRLFGDVDFAGGTAIAAKIRDQQEQARQHLQRRKPTT